MVRSRVEGMDAVRRVFARLKTETQAKIAEALVKGAEEIAAAARVLAPVSVPQAGAEHVKDEIRVGQLEVRKDQKSVVIRVTAGAGSAENRNAAFRSEFGRKRGGQGTPNHPGTTRQPFMFPAYLALRKRVRNRVGRAIGAAAREAAKAGRSTS